MSARKRAIKRQQAREGVQPNGRRKWRGPRWTVESVDRHVVTICPACGGSGNRLAGTRPFRTEACPSCAGRGGETIPAQAGLSATRVKSTGP